MSPPLRPQVDVENSQIAPRKDYTETLKEIVAQGFCPFCEEHLLKHHRKPILFRSESWLVTENSWPYEGTRHHFLCIALPHVEKIEDSPTLLTDLQRVYERIVTTYNMDGATLMIRSGNTRVTGASVAHLHAHVIVGKEREQKSEPLRAVVGYK